MMKDLDFHINTNIVASKDALSYWNDHVCKTFIMLDVFNNNNKENFYGSLDVHHLDTIQVCKISSQNNSVQRTKQQIAKSTDDFFIVNFQLKGESIIRQDRRVVHLRPNDWTFTDSTRPYTLDSKQDFEQLVLKIPRAMITYGTSYITGNTAILLDNKGGLGKIVKNFILTLNDELSEINVFTRKYLAHTLIQLLNDFLNSKFVTNKNNTPSKETALLKIKAFVEENITNSELSILLIAKTFNCSKRQLHNIFSGQDLTLNNFIRESRLQKCKNDLENVNLLKLTISEICYKNGYNDISNFAKSFKHKFGIPPGEYRNLCLESNNQIKTQYIS
ncbi:helix-turn-helix domain-containing protein [uncultured Maribacter sp.]|uniref:AraC-like ligand-binding domain-containing protein n=1 Tax=uncultured Maribacter sp. TaxID=431308 RepID=UPI00260ECACE|nr:helix-turn-helix domain-containing protein [uncultured Maribacter sp.]